MSAYYRATVGSFVAETVDSVQGKLSQGTAADGFFTIYGAQVGVWTNEIAFLKCALEVMTSQLSGATEWGLLLEYPIPRRSRRVDAVLLADDIVVVMEFKEGADAFGLAAREQVEDYALDLRDFHAESRNRTIIPILVGPTEPAGSSPGTMFANAPVKDVRATGPAGLAEQLISAYRDFHVPEAIPIDLIAWDTSKYWPVPTIIEAAEWLFRGHDVTQIAHSYATRKSLQRATQAVVDVVRNAQRECRKVLCIVTGVPGAGKTLVGLNAIHNPQLRANDRPAGTFLSGNGPLVMVLRRALVLDAKSRGAHSVRDAEDVVRTFVAGVHTFYQAHYGTGSIPDSYNKVVVFDEAQRAWSRERVYRKSEKKLDVSEPEMMLEIMDRHDWAVIVALVGSGQEIHSGEAGLAEWGRALGQKFKHWRVVSAGDSVLAGSASSVGRLFDGDPPVEMAYDERVHLPVSARAIRAERLSEWVNLLLAGDSERARELAAGAAADFGLVCTRSLAAARIWLRHNTRGTQRCGLVASSSDERMRFYGLELSSGFTQRYEWDCWYLAGGDDVRSSNKLEVAATEFHCQGLELDWVGVCWGSDFTRTDDSDGWDHRDFAGSEWRQVGKPEDRAFLKNAYRVLLTRARKGMVLWVPAGSPDDPTLDPKRLDRTYQYLLSCGLAELQ